MTSTASDAIAAHRVVIIDALRALGVAAAWVIRPAWVGRPDADTGPLEIAVKFRKRPVGSFAYYSRLIDLETEISEITKPRGPFVLVFTLCTRIYCLNSFIQLVLAGSL